MKNRTGRLIRGAGLLGLVGALVLAVVPLCADEVADRQDAVKAAYLFNFLKFTRWPDGRFKTPEEPISVGILGQSRVTEVFAEAIQAREVQGRSIQAIVLKLPEVLPEDSEAIDLWIKQKMADLAHCHMIYIALPKGPFTDRLLSALRKQDVLTVGDQAGFAESGGIIGLFLDAESGKVAFAINVTVLNGTKLKISSQLLKLAHLVNEEAAASGTQPFSGRAASP